jgi:hypothetical protein
MDAQNMPCVYWLISCFDKRRKNPFPRYNRRFVLDWAQVSPAEAEQILIIVRASRPKSRHSPKGFNTAVVTVSHGSRTTSDPRILEYRRYFREAKPGEVNRRFMEAPDILYVAEPYDDYCEDETGKPISEIEQFQYITGEETPILAGKSKSVLRIGPTPPAHPETWAVETANTIAQLLEVFERIVSSAWCRTPPSMTYEVSTPSGSSLPEPSASTLLEAVFADHEETMAVLAYFRQLCSKKDWLLVKATDLYLKHCSDGRKQVWVATEKAEFESVIVRKTWPFDLGYGPCQLLEMFIYGARMLHASSDHADDDRLNALVKLHGSHKLVMIFNHSLREILAPVARICRVVHQDFQHWLAEHGLAQPDRQEIAKLFQAFQRD